MNTEINNGIKSFFVLGIYFLIVEISGVKHTSFLRLLNGLIIAYFINKSISERMSEGRNFIALFGSAIFTNLVAVMLSTIALAGYMYFFRGADYISELAKPLLALGIRELSVSQFSFAIFAEGIASGVVLSFVLMQYWKNKMVKSNEGGVKV